MATPHKIDIKDYAGPTEVFGSQPLRETLQKASELLQMNHDNYHIYIHNLGLHNHILHHILAIVVLGGSTAQLQSAYNLAVDSQRPNRPPDAVRVSDMSSPVHFHKYLGKGKYYDDYFAFFQNEISRNGVPNTVNEFLFKGDDRAEDLFQRFFSGFLHSPIHLGYAIEFDQPLVAAEALALTAVHDASFGSILALIESSTDESSTGESLISIQEKLHGSDCLNRAMDFTHGVSQIRDGFLENSKEEFLRLIGSWKVNQNEMDERTAETLNSACQ
ncbi:hypothetical protein N7478_003956 [Penicillium angulare]|uniref:uncharacterized protein n=1 Tax=Penicillium angulare TaxID=116970 RepID=UPI00253F893F|nr:uncharacterized protein N7478_003956 [Penicillium angulare]KAJ5278584.1 hypothetical protein N7478_003956 [Penicillium angulare]